MPYQSDLPDTLIVDGTDLQTLDGVYFNGLEFLIAPGTPRGTQDTIPGEDGAGGTDSAQRGVGLPVDAYQFTVSVEVRGVDSDEHEPSDEVQQRGLFIANLQALAAAVTGTDSLVSLTRRLTNAAGDGYDEFTADGMFLGGLTPTDNNPPSVGQFELQFMNLSGRWYDGSAWVLP